MIRPHELRDTDGFTLQAVEAPSTADIVGYHGELFNAKSVDGSLWDRASSAPPSGSRWSKGGNSGFPIGAKNGIGCARRSWRGPAGESPARVRRSEPPGSECCRRDW